MFCHRPAISRFQILPTPPTAADLAVNVLKQAVEVSQAARDLQFVLKLAKLGFFNFFKPAMLKGTFPIFGQLLAGSFSVVSKPIVAC